MEDDEMSDEEMREIGLSIGARKRLRRAIAAAPTATEGADGAAAVLMEAGASPTHRDARHDTRARCVPPASSQNQNRGAHSSCLCVPQTHAPGLGCELRPRTECATGTRRARRAPAS